VTQLNVLCGDKTKVTGRTVHRSEIISDLIARRHAAINGRKRRG
jgi:hypothetical protein